jgi:LmbE family N-acetylglucosaminyl deacetylase
MLATALLLFGACGQREDIRPYAPTEVFPTDAVLSTIEPKRAMIVIAHDDDMCAMSGTISMLNSSGWEIAVLSFGNVPERMKAQTEACREILDTVMFIPMAPDQYRTDITPDMKPYEALPKSDFAVVFKSDLIRGEYESRINAYDPQVIFTLDNEIGGYGHPEHVFVSQMVLDLASENRINPRYVYQSVFTDHMEQTIMERLSGLMKGWGFDGDGWQKAQRTYGVSGMPEPTVQFDIKKQAAVKMDYLRSYNERERKVIGFYLPAFEDYDAEEYFGVFDREFFRVIEIESQGS